MTKSSSLRGRVGHLPRVRRRGLYVVSVGTWLTGVLWVIFHYFVKAKDSFGFENPHPAEHWWLVAHGTFACAAVWFFGVLWPGHVKKSWNLHIRRWSGGTLFGFAAWLSLTGVALYYIGSDKWRSWTSLGHWIAGVVTIAAFLVHLLTRTARRDQAAARRSSNPPPSYPPE